MNDQQKKLRGLFIPEELEKQLAEDEGEEDDPEQDNRFQEVMARAKEETESVAKKLLNKEYKVDDLLAEVDDVLESNVKEALSDLKDDVLRHVRETISGKAIRRMFQEALDKNKLPWGDLENKVTEVVFSHLGYEIERKENEE